MQPDYSSKLEKAAALAAMFQGPCTIGCFVNDNGINGTGVFVELCAMPDKMPFYQNSDLMLTKRSD